MEEILPVLEGLIQRVTSPVVRRWLEEAHADIAYLTGCDNLRAGRHGQTVAT